MVLPTAEISSRKYERCPSRPRVFPSHGQVRVQPGGGDNSGGDGGGVAGGTVALGKVDLDRLLSRLAAAGPSRQQILAELDSKVALPPPPQQWNARLRELLRTGKVCHAVSMFCTVNELLRVPLCVYVCWTCKWVWERY